MKRIFGLTILLAAILLLVSCESSVTLTAPNVTAAAINDGATLRLTWTEVSDADGYYIYADGVAIDTLDADATSYDATVPALLYEVTAYAGEDESDADQIDCEAKVTATLDVWDNTEPPPNPSGFGFNTSGTAVAYQLTDTTNWTNLDYYILGGTPQQFVSPNGHTPPYNNEGNVTKNSGSTDFDALTIADAPGAYTSPTNITANAVYYFWIDPTDNGWDASTDYFGKIKVEAISGKKVTMKLAIQLIPGLRWCVTE
jgi:hypothetical protein